MRFVTWNLKWGGEDRIDRIADVIRSHNPDVAVLTEYQAERSAPLMTSLATAGWSHQLATNPPPRRGGVAIASKFSLVQRARPASLEAFSFRFLPVGIPEAGLELRAMYGPLHREPYGEYWSAVLASLEAEAQDSVLVLGDFNAGESHVDAPVHDFLASSYFTQLPLRGYTDLWRHGRDRSENEATWLGPRNPYRLDHAFGTATVLERLEACEYDHSVREAGHSDHSLLSVSLRESPCRSDTP